jgi:Xaa-Pro aminopeptidase
MSADGLPTHDHAARRARLRPALDEAEVELLLVTDPANVRYLSGFTGSNGQVLVAADPDHDRLITDDRYRARAALEAPDLVITISRDPVKVALDHLAAVAPAVGRVGFDADHLTWRAAETLRERAAEAGLDAAPTVGLVERLREVKDDAEVARLARACELTTEALRWLFDEVASAGMTERALAFALERRFVDLGADGIAFDSIVASGPNAAVPHHAPTDRPLVAGDLLTVDCGALVDGYHADCTRTVAIGHLDDELVEIYEVVRLAQVAGREAAIAGATGEDVDAAARGVIEAAGLGERFVHGTGHGVGLAIHEAPAVGQGSAATLRAGTALTVEPGVYLPGLGGVRIEDTIVVTADGPARTLTDIPRELRVL